MWSGKSVLEPVPVESCFEGTGGGHKKIDAGRLFQSLMTDCEGIQTSLDKYAGCQLKCMYLFASVFHMERSLPH